MNKQGWIAYGGPFIKSKKGWGYTISGNSFFDIQELTFNNKNKAIKSRNYNLKKGKNVSEIYKFGY